MLFVLFFSNKWFRPKCDKLACRLGEDLIIELRQHTDYITGIHSVLFAVSNELTWVDQLKNLLNWLNLIILIV